jgi:outer membrane protein insertion porin family
MMKVSHFHTVFGFSTKLFLKKHTLKLILFMMLGVVPLSGNETDFKFNEKSIHSVRFIGNTHFRDRELRRMISTTSAGLFKKRRIFNTRVLKRDFEEIERNYHAEGYLKCDVSDSLVMHEKNRVKVFIFISEGEQFYVKNFSVQGNSLIDERKILSLLKIEEGEPFKPFEYQQGLQLIQDEYGKLGRPFVKIEDHITENVRMEISLHIDEDDTYRIKSIDVTGNEQVEEKTIRREIVVDPGDIFDLNDIRKSRLHIFELGPFNSVNILPVNRNPDSLTVDLRIRVSESLPRRWDANIGVRQGRIAELNQTYLFTQVDWLHKNLFNKARRFQVKGNFGIVWDQETFFRKSSPSYGLDLSYTRPRILYMRLPTTLKVYYNKDVYSPFARRIDKNDELITAGMEVSSIWRLERKLYTLGSFSLRSVESILSDEKSEIQRRIAGQIRFDNRDNFLFPRKGWNILADLQLVKGISDNPTEYLQWNGSVSRYQVLSENSVIAVRIETGMIHNRTDKPPLLVMYRMGTETTVRGWSQSIGREFLTPDGLTVFADYAKVLGNAEWRISLPKNFGLEFFIDAGQLDADFQRLWDIGQFYISTGPGLTYSTFIGPLRLEFPFVLQDPSGRFNRWEQPERHFIIALLFAF